MIKLEELTAIGEEQSSEIKKKEEIFRGFVMVE